MAGFQQAANAIVGAPGQVMRSTGIYNELVGKNEELIKELGGKNEELEKKNKDITEKNKTIKSQYKDLEKKNSELQDLYDTVKQRQEWELQMKKEAEEEYNRKSIETQKKRKATMEFKKVIERRASIIDREWERNASHMSKNMMTTALYGDLSSGSGGGI